MAEWLTRQYGSSTLKLPCGCELWLRSDHSIDAEYFCTRHRKMLSNTDDVRLAWWRTKGGTQYGL